MRILVTGSDGFIGKNLQVRLAERSDIEVICFTREHDQASLSGLLEGVSLVVHLAGVNRPVDPEEFVTGNQNLTEQLCAAIVEAKRDIRVIYTSSSQAVQENKYGMSKLAAEDALFHLQSAYGIPVHIFRLPNVFGKWSKPNYNSVVATFCHNTARGLSLQINDPSADLTLVYVDDVVERFIELIDLANAEDAGGFETVTPEYRTTVGAIANQLAAFKNSRSSLTTERVGTGLVRALYSTYLSFLPPNDFAYSVPQHGDVRGVFVEMLKTPDCGQFSYFTAHPGITRGGHYHHSKTEKFLVVKGHASFKFRHMLTGETYQLETSGEKAEIVETVPGWTHDITNIGADEMLVMLWANEVFDRAKPDTFACPL